MKMQRLSLTAALLAAVACSSVQQVRDPAAFLATNPTQILVTYEDRSEVPVAMPKLRNDTIVGTWDGLSEPVALPLNRISRIDAVQKDTKKTALFIGGLVAVTAATAYGLSRESTDYGEVCDYNRPGGGGNFQEFAGPCYRTS
jgi:hypothetical protein